MALLHPGTDGRSFLSERPLGGQISICRQAAGKPALCRVLRIVLGTGFARKLWPLPASTFSIRGRSSSRSMFRTQGPSVEQQVLTLHACSVNTPTKTRGVGAGKAADLTYWEGAARVIASVSTSSKIIVEKSTVPVKTAEAIEKVRRGCVVGLWGSELQLALGGHGSTLLRTWQSRLPWSVYCAVPGVCWACGLKKRRKVSRHALRCSYAWNSMG